MWRAPKANVIQGLILAFGGLSLFVVASTQLVAKFQKSNFVNMLAYIRLPLTVKRRMSNFYNKRPKLENNSTSKNSKGYQDWTWPLHQNSVCTARLSCNRRVLHSNQNKFEHTHKLALIPCGIKAGILRRG